MQGANKDVNFCTSGGVGNLVGLERRGVLEPIHCEKPRTEGGNPEGSAPPSTRAVLCLFTSDESAGGGSSPKTYGKTSGQNIT